MKRRHVWVTAGAALVAALLSVGTPNAEAVIEPVYTLPFYDGYRISCGFGCYTGHEGVDYEIAPYGVGGQSVAAAASGTAKPCPPSQSAGNYIVANHGNGHRTRYLHLQGYAVAGEQSVARGQVVGYEGSTGHTDPPGFNHLHFETRHGATTFTCGFDGTAVDPYAPSTYMWTTNPPSYPSASLLTDLFLWRPATGQTTVKLRDPGPDVWDSAPSPPTWTGGWEVYPGHYNGDSYTDLFLWRPLTGQWTVKLSDGAGGWATGVTGPDWSTDWDIYPGDYDDS